MKQKNILIQPDEKIMMLLHRHWIALLPPLIIFIILIFVLIGFYILAASNYTFLLQAPIRSATLLISCIYLLFLWLYFFVIWTDYYLDVWIVTDKKIIDVEQMGLFNRETSEFKLYRVQDVTIEVKGIIATFFNYGNVHVQTAGEAVKFIFKQVPNPQQAKDLILKLQNQAVQDQLKSGL